LRIAIQGDKDCAQLHTEFNLHNPADKAVFDKCSQWLGPNLPGITTPDFSSSSSMARLDREAGRPAVRVGERRGSGQPELGPVRAVTVLIAIIAVFIAYNANRGLPFVPTYDLSVELPSGDKLVRGNEVRTGGFRVGVVSEIAPKTVVVKGRRLSVAVAKLKLDKVVEPLAVDTRLRVRPRSALGLKYVELTPGRSRRSFSAGDTIPLANSAQPLELEDVFSTFQPRTRENARAATA